MSVSRIGVKDCIHSARDCANVFNDESVYVIEIETKYGTTVRKKRLSELMKLDVMLRMCYPVVVEHLPPVPPRAFGAVSPLRC